MGRFHLATLSQYSLQNSAFLGQGLLENQVCSLFLSNFCKNAVMNSSFIEQILQSNLPDVTVFTDRLDDLLRFEPAQQSAVVRCYAPPLNRVSPVQLQQSI